MALLQEQWKRMNNINDTGHHPVTLSLWVFGQTCLPHGCFDIVLFEQTNKQTKKEKKWKNLLFSSSSEQKRERTHFSLFIFCADYGPHSLQPAWIPSSRFVLQRQHWDRSGFPYGRLDYWFCSNSDLHGKVQKETSKTIRPSWLGQNLLWESLDRQAVQHSAWLHSSPGWAFRLYFHWALFCFTPL